MHLEPAEGEPRAHLGLRLLSECLMNGGDIFGEIPPIAPIPVSSYGSSRQLAAFDLLSMFRQPCFEVGSHAHVESHGAVRVALAELDCVHVTWRSREDVKPIVGESLDDGLSEPLQRFRSCARLPAVGQL